MVGPNNATPIETLNQRIPLNEGSDSDSDQDEWADANDELPPSGIPEPSSVEYPEGREPEEKFTEEEFKVRIGLLCLFFGGF